MHNKQMQEDQQMVKSYQTFRNWTSSLYFTFDTNCKWFLKPNLDRLLEVYVNPILVLIKVREGKAKREKHQFIIS